MFSRIKRDPLSRNSDELFDIVRKLHYHPLSFSTHKSRPIFDVQKSELIHSRQGEPGLHDPEIRFDLPEMKTLSSKVKGVCSDSVRK